MSALSARPSITAAGLLFLVMASGCGSPLWGAAGWVADYDKAERRVADTGRELLIYYRGVHKTGHDLTEESLAKGDVQRHTREFVKCRLFKAYEPDRRYVAQFGVERAPALIRVHQNGTYHAQTGPMSVDDIIAFLDGSQEPGTPPDLNAQIPREVEYRWRTSADKARAEAARSGAPILFAFERWWSGDWRRLEKLLERSEVHARFARMVHARIGSFWPAGRREAETLGVTQWPALVLAYPDGRVNVLELPNSFEEVARFADAAARAEPNVPAVDSHATAASDSQAPTTP